MKHKVFTLFQACRSLMRPEAIICIILAALPSVATGQALSFKRDRSRKMLETIKRDIEQSYYDPTFKGVDLNTVFKQADELLKKADSDGQMHGIIARALLELNDSHTYFIPPSRAARVDYGWTMQTVGDKCFIAAVQPGSDAEKKGLRAGDLVHSIDQMNPTRDTLWIIKYLYFLRPTPVIQFVVESPGEQPRQLEVLAKVTPGKRITDLSDYNQFMQLLIEEEKDARLRRHRYTEIDDVFIWKMPAFDLPPEKVDDMIGKIKKHKALILDLRGNGGGAEVTLLRMIGNLFTEDVTVGALIRRKDRKPMTAKTRGADSAFKGRLVVLIDSDSGSSAELLARVVQLEKRGIVIGDRSAGAVMRAKHIPREHGVDVVIFYGVAVTDADLIMKDGKSLEKKGVTPDELVLPAPAEIGTQSDPVLSRAAAMVGLKLDPQRAGILFPVEWRK